MAELWPWIAIAAAAIATYAWRGLGVLLAGHINPTGPVFQWVGSVAYALLAGLISRMILLPGGPLATTHLADRAASAVVALAVYFLSRRNLVLGVAAGTLALVVLTLARFG